MSCIEPAKAMISATSANINKLFVGSIKEINISDDQCEKFKEIILASDPTSDGEFTAQFIYEKIKDLCPLITRIAIGVPIGSEVNYIDKNTLAKSLIDRRTVSYTHLTLPTKA